ncbi:hypothetical protein [Effusibacillus lacus]|uniref:Uncharacterized protein n=1 Tax=Effusibacillus lacus TaxID=1348429 RepID=A0A292YHT4_9BACL|nr:hypothetical protein [Effusibacillus lacus]TCS73144.1 hypothetical protein EDD64_11923 [Effusibacillus lacus]GAX90547.1 hypothetical protein EFBL_2174 [Effusibacillus lacus]
MKKAKRNKNTRFMWAAGGIGFLISFASSFAAGNLLMTNLKRGVLGFVLIMVIAWAIQSFLTATVETKTSNPTEETGDPPVSGSRFDVSIPPEAIDTPPSAADFQPWIIGEQTEMHDAQAQNLARAVRAMSE